MELSLYHQAQVLYCAQEAIDNEDKKDYEAAIQSYTKAISSLNYSLTFEKEPIYREVFEGIITTHKDRIFQLRNRLFSTDTTSDTKLNDKKAKTKSKADKNSSWILQQKPNVKWTDIAGLSTAIKILQEAVVLPLQFPHFFNENRKPWSRILLYGVDSLLNYCLTLIQPPGTGKTRLAQAVATETNSHFFSISASDIISCWYGGSEKKIKKLFQEAAAKKPSIIFFDEIDSLCRSRNESEDEHSRRLKTELLKQLEGTQGLENGVIILGATNRPWELDSAMLRRFEKRIYIGLPDENSRKILLKMRCKDQDITEDQFTDLAKLLEGYSGSDISIVIKDAFMEPIRELQDCKYWKPENNGYIPTLPTDPNAIESFYLSLPSLSPPRNITMSDLLKSIHNNPPSTEDTSHYELFTKQRGQF